MTIEIKVKGVELEIELDDYNNIVSVQTCSADIIDNLLSEEAKAEIRKKVNGNEV